MPYEKRFIDVICKHTFEGVIVPLIVLYDDVRKYEVDKVLDIRKSASIHGGNLGIRYTCMIMGKEKHLYYDWTCKKWFVEIKSA